MNKEEFYKKLLNRNSVKIMDVILSIKTSTDYSLDEIMEQNKIDFGEFKYAIDKIFEYVFNFDQIAIVNRGLDKDTIIKSNLTETFINEGGFEKEYNDIMNEQLDNRVYKKRKNKLLKWQLIIFWPLFLISIISLIISLIALLK